uniref:Uncharacterized protein n=1 Tax=Panagrellus redivivus TaxID=6233 RepID=A0A7E4W7L8_PANRE
MRPVASDKRPVASDKSCGRQRGVPWLQLAFRGHQNGVKRRIGAASAELPAHRDGLQGRMGSPRKYAIDDRGEMPSKMAIFNEVSRYNKMTERGGGQKSRTPKLLSKP